MNPRSNRTNYYIARLENDNDNLRQELEEMKVKVKDDEIKNLKEKLAQSKK